MSVIVPNRNVAHLEFLNNARKIHKLILQMCINNVSKRQNQYVGVPFCDVARRIHEECKIANSIYATNEKEQQLRINHFIMARANTYACISDLEIFNEVADFPKGSVKELSNALNYELKLLTGILKEERAKLKS